MNNYQNYMTVCSERTLQSSNKGFFMQFVDNVSECAGKDWVLNVFGTLKSDRERIRLIYEDKTVSKCDFYSKVSYANKLG